MDGMTPRELLEHWKKLPETARMPAIFVGHGSPMNGIEDNVFVRGWEKLGKDLPRPRAILSISAHWLTRGTEVHVTERPRTIHDFWGFPKQLYDLSYPCPGSPEDARALEEMVKSVAVRPDLDWGIDHGTWIVLHRMYPAADIPVFQMSIDMTRSHKEHYELAKELALLRRRGVLIIGSGNLVHNLGEIDFNEQAAVFPWAEDFDAKAKDLLLAHDHSSLIQYEKLGHAAQLSIPTPDHYWPLLYILGLQEDDEEVSFPIEGIAHGSISMRCVLIG
jgi:4,5-DOPA dioxygenase extradiol